jgi:hypothetical protein
MTKRINGGENSAFNIKEIKTVEQDWSLGYDSLDKLDDAFFQNPVSGRNTQHHDVYR